MADILFKRKFYEQMLDWKNTSNSEKSSAIFKSIPEQLSNHNCKFKFSGINENAIYKNYVQAVRYVDESMIGNY